MKFKGLLIVCLLWITWSYAQTTKRVYFVGNSYTYYNNLPELIQKIAQSTNDHLEYDSHTPGGSRFQQHAANPTVLNKIAEGNWDHVVLQEQSQLPSFPQQQVANMVYPYARQLVDAFKTANPCGSAVFYMTWGRKYGDEQNCNNGLPQLCTYEGMDNALYTSYMKMATDNKSLISPVSKVWRAIREQNPGMELYIEDNSHPSYIGSMAAAFTFYTIFFKKDPTLTAFIGDLSPDDANMIKGIVKNIVFEHLGTWFVGVHDNPSHFKWDDLQNRTYKFDSLNPTATTYLWNFGDGATATIQNPQHTYQANGTYTVSLTTNACNTNATNTQTLTVTALSNTDFTKKQIRMYPNPATDRIYMTAIDFDQITVFDVLGKQMRVAIAKTDEAVQIDTEQLAPGTYFVQIQMEAEKQFYKFLKK
ncbi:PKD domain-containing protein [Flavobacterium sp.]|uniref:PKD domain-containing protein n=1 Tax=Flavobacterium sp. TaxID=239 RepID=UPI0026243F50|nr:PKD domain-containing protein [Flavobacterium sp.]